jgi:hypothetical protein
MKRKRSFWVMVWGLHSLTSLLSLWRGSTSEWGGHMQQKMAHLRDRQGETEIKREGEREGET